MKRAPIGSRRDLRAWLEHRRLPLGVALLAVLLCLPSLGNGWQADDYFHRLVLRGGVDTGYSPLELFSVMRHGPEVLADYTDLGLFPWFASEGLRLAFFRYLSAATHWLDYRLWPDSGVLQHAHSLLWFGGLVAAAALLYRRIHGVSRVAGLAALLYAVDEAHGAAAGWLANRNALVATLFGILCLLAHDRWRRDGGTGWRQPALAALFFALALASGELGLGAFAYLVAYALCLERGSPARRLASLAPATAVLAVWAVVYRVFGFGASGSGLYVDPVGQPAEFAARLVERAPFYLAGQLTPLPAELSILAPAESAAAVRWLMVAASLAMAAILAPLVARRREARFWALGGGLALVPLCATFPSNRVLFFAGLGGMGLVAMWLEGAWTRGGARRALRRPVAIGLVLTHLVLAPLLLPLNALAFRLFGQQVSAAILTLPGDVGGRQLVIVNAPDYLSYVSQVASVLALDGRRMPSSVRGLAIGPSAVSLRGIDERTLEATMERGFLAGPLGPLFRDPNEPFEVGQAFRVRGLTATVLTLTPAGDPATVSFRFDESLTAPHRRWVRFVDGRFEPFLPPTAGRQIDLPPALGPFEQLAGSADPPRLLGWRSGQGSISISSSSAGSTRCTASQSIVGSSFALVGGATFSAASASSFFNSRRAARLACFSRRFCWRILSRWRRTIDA